MMTKFHSLMILLAFAITVVNAGNEMMATASSFRVNDANTLRSTVNMLCDEVEEFKKVSTNAIDAMSGLEESAAKTDDIAQQVDDLSDTSSVLSSTLLVASKIPKVGLVFKGPQKIFKTASSKLSKLNSKTKEANSKMMPLRSPLEKAIEVAELAPGFLATASFSIKDVSNFVLAMKQCAEEAAPALNPEAVALMRRLTASLQSAVNHMRDFIRPVLGQMKAIAQQASRFSGLSQTLNAISSVVDAANGLVGPFKGLSDAINQEITIPWFPESYGRGVGRSPDCPSGQENDAGLCYPKCRTGYTGVSFLCWKGCGGFGRNDGAFCAKPAAYGRGVGRSPCTGCTGCSGCSWGGCSGCSGCSSCSTKYCRSSEDVNGLLCYPKCRSGYHNVGCCICSPNCPSGMTDIGVSCAKQTYNRGVGKVPLTCRSGEDLWGLLCYPKCRSGFSQAGCCLCSKPAEAKFKIKDIFDAIESAIEAVKDIPLIGDIIAAIDDAIDALAGAILEPIISAIPGLTLDIPEFNLDLDFSSLNVAQLVEYVKKAISAAFEDVMALTKEFMETIKDSSVFPSACNFDDKVLSQLSDITGVELNQGHRRQLASSKSGEGPSLMQILSDTTSMKDMMRYGTLKTLVSTTDKLAGMKDQETKNGRKLALGINKHFDPEILTLFSKSAMYSKASRTQDVNEMKEVWMAESLDALGSRLTKSEKKGELYVVHERLLSLDGERFSTANIGTKRFACMWKAKFESNGMFKKKKLSTYEYEEGIKSFGMKVSPKLTYHILDIEPLVGLYDKNELEHYYGPVLTHWGKKCPEDSLNVCPDGAYCYIKFEKRFPPVLAKQLKVVKSTEPQIRRFDLPGEMKHFSLIAHSDTAKKKIDRKWRSFGTTAEIFGEALKDAKLMVQSAINALGNMPGTISPRRLHEDLKTLIYASFGNAIKQSTLKNQVRKNFRSILEWLNQDNFVIVHNDGKLGNTMQFQRVSDKKAYHMQAIQVNFDMEKLKLAYESGKKSFLVRAVASVLIHESAHRCFNAIDGQLIGGHKQPDKYQHTPGYITAPHYFSSLIVQKGVEILSARSKDTLTGMLNTDPSDEIMCAIRQNANECDKKADTMKDDDIYSNVRYFKELMHSAIKGRTLLNADSYAAFAALNVHPLLNNKRNKITNRLDHCGKAAVHCRASDNTIMLSITDDDE